MKFISRLFLIFVIVAVTAACGRINTGNVGVRTEWNKTINTEEIKPGFYVAVFSSVDEYVTKETEMRIKSRPKAADNLTLDIFDYSVFYTVNEAMVAELLKKYSGMTVYNEGLHYPAYKLVARVVDNAGYKAAALTDSLQIHKSRELLATEIHDLVQSALDKSDPNTFSITKVVVNNAVTDPEVEESIKSVIKMQKEAERKREEIAMAKNEAERVIEEARGQAESIRLINEQLTPAFVQYQQVLATQAFADLNRQGSHTVVLPSGMQPLINVK